MFVFDLNIDMDLAVNNLATLTSLKSENSLVRFSVGIEDVDDLIEDLENAFGAI